MSCCRVGQIITVPPHCGFRAENLSVGMLKEYVLEKKKINGKKELMSLLIEDSSLVGMSPKIKKKIAQEMSIVQQYEEKAKSRPGNSRVT